MDMKCLYIAVLCALNTTVQLKKKSNIHNEIFDSKEIFSQIHKLSDKFGLNSTSIADITKIPKTTVLRKLAKLQKLNILKKNKFKRYATQDLANSSIGKKEYYPQMQYTLKLLGIFISECLETYFSKDFKVS